MLLNQKQIDMYWLKGLTSAVDYYESHITDGGILDDEIKKGLAIARERLIKILDKCKGRIINSSNPGITLLTILNGILSALELRPYSIASGFAEAEETLMFLQIERMTNLLK